MGLLALFCFVGVAGLLQFQEAEGQSRSPYDWKSFKEFYGKTYATPAEETEAERQFNRNLQRVVQNTRSFNSGDVGHQLELNKFADEDPKEFLRVRNGLKMKVRGQKAQPAEPTEKRQGPEPAESTDTRQNPEPAEPTETRQGPEPAEPTETRQEPEPAEPTETRAEPAEPTEERSDTRPYPPRPHPRPPPGPHPTSPPHPNPPPSPPDNNNGTGPDPDNGGGGGDGSGFDWRSKNAVSQVRDQGQCGGCWAFSAMGAIESQVMKNGGSQVLLSEQQLIDCDRTDSGCGGGNPFSAFTWLKKNGGADADADYPYTSGNGRPGGSCRASKAVQQVTGQNELRMPTDQETLKSYLQKNGPLSIGVDASSWDSQYKSGTISKPPRTPNHAVMLVGWGSDSQGPYWIVKNSWSEHWGMQGFCHIAMGPNDSGVTKYMAGYPTV